jgi:nitroimidazol reductase NimA-like FMN-containing flavoprotein (pyridoxamine 5'-phosphate oxidase superfamily)
MKAGKDFDRSFTESKIDDKIKRHSERSVSDIESINKIIDEALICHVAFSIDGMPYNIPMLHVRIGHEIYVHTSIKSRFYSILSSGSETCLTVTLLDGIVLAKSAYNSSMNYRSVILFGKMEPVTDISEKRKVAENITEKMAIGRWKDCRQPSEQELSATGMLKLSISRFSAKVRSGPPIDNKDDLDLPYWSGVVPISRVKMPPVTSPVDQNKIDAPGYIMHINRI